MKGRIALAAAACLTVIPQVASGAAGGVMEHGIFSPLEIDHALPAWWWMVLVGTAVVLLAPVLFWKRRRGYTVAASLFFCVLVATMWSRSYRGVESVTVYSWRDGPDRSVYKADTLIASSAGGLSVRYLLIWSHHQRMFEPATGKFTDVYELPKPLLSYGRGDQAEYPGLYREDAVGILPFQDHNNRQEYRLAAQVRRKWPNTTSSSSQVVEDNGIVTPYWLVLVVVSIPPVQWAIRFWRLRYRKTHTRCVQCGYDLRASEERCPECGTAIPKKNNLALESGAQPGSITG